MRLPREVRDVPSLGTGQVGWGSDLVGWGSDLVDDVPGHCSPGLD